MRGRRGETAHRRGFKRNRRDRWKTDREKIQKKNNQHVAVRNERLNDRKDQTGKNARGSMCRSRSIAIRGGEASQTRIVEG